MTSVVFDVEQGVLRLSHAALSVLARLAADPSDPALRDHAVAEPLAALRAAGVLGRGGIHPEVAPLAEAVGRARRTLDLTVTERNTARVHHGWLTPPLVVLAVSAGQTFDLVADHPRAFADLVGDLVDLPAASEAGEAEGPVVEGHALDTVLDALQRHWRLTIHDGEDSRAVDVYDAGPAGLWLGEPAAEPTVLGRTSTAAVRRRLLEAVGVEGFA